MSKKLFVGNLPFRAGGNELKTLFSKYGEVEEATVISDKFTNRSKGFGFVTFTNDADADKAVKELNEFDFEGRKLTVNGAKPREEKN